MCHLYQSFPATLQVSLSSSPCSGHMDLEVKVCVPCALIPACNTGGIHREEASIEILSSNLEREEGEVKRREKRGREERAERREKREKRGKRKKEERREKRQIKERGEKEDREKRE